MKTIIIAGITRSGLTLTMQMLHAGGYPCYGEYPAFEGYEIGKINFKESEGKAIKVVDTHIQIPPDGEYYVIRLWRNYTQQSKSISKFLNVVCGIMTTRKMIRDIERNLPKDYAIIDKWVKKQKGYMLLGFDELINDPNHSASKIRDFIDYPLDIKKMISCVKSRSTDCYPGMMEVEFFNNSEDKR